jgi:hypothetical protein
MSRSPTAAMVTTIALIAAAGLIAGCGGGSSVPRLRASGPISKAEATAYAQAVNLVPADVPAMDSLGREGEAKGGDHPDQLLTRCDGETGRYLVQIHSPHFQRARGQESEGVGSTVDVTPTAGAAAHDFELYASSQGRACTARLLPLVVEPTRRLRPGRPQVSFFHLALPHGSAFGVRLSVPFTVMGGAVPTHTEITIDSLDFLAGPARISLKTVGSPNPVSSSTERHLLAVLYGRAKT